MIKNSIPTYVINLKRNPERRLYMQRQLDSLGLDCQWIEAIDARDFKPTELEGLDLEGKHQPASMACLLSHVKCYDQIIQSKHCIACVLEDDAELLSTFPGILNCKELQKADWELLLLAHRSVMTRRLVNLYFRPTKKQRNDMRYYQYFLGAMVKNPSCLGIKNHYIAEPQGDSPSTIPVSAIGYLVKLSAAKKLKEIALTHQKSLYIDDITGCADLFGVTLRLITPPCVKINPIYLRYSGIDAKRYKREYENINLNTLPHQELLELYIRDKWAALTSHPLKVKLRICFLITLIKLELSKIIEYVIPWKRYNRRIYRIRNR